MKQLLIALISTAAALSAAPISSVKLINAGSPAVIASSVTVDGDTKTGVYIGPYTLSINGQNVAAICIDFFDASHVGDVWNSYVTQVGSSNLSSTYNPTYGQEYDEAAYIYSQIVKPGSDRTGLQEAAWDIMAYGITNSSYKYLIGDNSYIDAALSNWNKIDLTGYEIVSDVTAHGEQEFLCGTPEPGSVMLLGAGLALVGGGMYRRRRAIGSRAS